MSLCKIHLDNHTCIYYPGSDLRGRVECSFPKETTIYCIKIQLKCQERNQWTGTESYRDHNNKPQTRTITLNGHNDIFSAESILYGTDSRTRILHGKHTFPFSYVLPHNIPSTFIGPYGSITFKLKAIVTRPVMRFDYKDEFILTVVSPIDFNAMPRELQDSRTYCDEKTVCCWPCGGGYVSMNVEIPKRAYIPGEIMYFKVFISNMSRSNVKSLQIKLKKTITYTVTSPRIESHKDMEDLVVFKEHGVGAHNERTYNLQLTVPRHLSVPNFTNCRLFDAGYCLKISCEMGGCTLSLDVNIRDIAMGHVQWTNVYNVEGFQNEIPPSGWGYQPPPVYSVGDPPYPSTSNAVDFPMSTSPIVPIHQKPTQQMESSDAAGGPSNYQNNDLVPPPSYDEVEQTTVIKKY